MRGGGTGHLLSSGPKLPGRPASLMTDEAAGVLWQRASLRNTLGNYFRARFKVEVRLNRAW
jgi:hypothetical protein